jgi:hypothetical protein
MNGQIILISGGKMREARAPAIILPISSEVMALAELAKDVFGADPVH